MWVCVVYVRAKRYIFIAIVAAVTAFLLEILYGTTSMYVYVNLWIIESCRSAVFSPAREYYIDRANFCPHLHGVSFTIQPFV